jgi:hopanoid biosynthesis associated protein HpnK
VTRLIVNADDFGLTAGVNRAIAELHRARVLTSATLMARATATDEAVAMARSMPTLGVGCHVVLVDGEPVLPPRELPTLVNQKTGRFHPTLGAFLRRLYSGRIRDEELEAESTAQIELLKGRGVALTHIDAHKHSHMFPAVLRPVLRAAHAAGIHVVRNPFEPGWSMNATPRATLVRRMQVKILRKHEPEFRRIAVTEGFKTTDGAMGVLATGSVDLATVAALLAAMPHGTFELVSHPGYYDKELVRVHTRLLHSREIERNALLAIANVSGIKLISFAELNDPRELTVTR